MRIAYPVGRKAIRIIVYPKSVIRPFIVFFNYCLQSFVFYKASFVCF